MSETVAVKIGERPVPAKTKRGGWEAHTTYQIPKTEAKAIVEAKLGSYAKKNSGTDVRTEEEKKAENK
jgi:hypothetical protein